ncbi:glycoside hydrolase family 13 protein [Desulforamulus ruminis]|uniref:Alpha amylase catalytic region n=1 Tax=Desulforamulus ruminis (strain ATCC 23193 / DSM 2154 / NCIMB 8452 / DL) TaxID=696281 RepID=F6DPX2_DESRL|nr:glycoside hydrolase family 13 protein [Desulforamulus ruminis]AEG60811.1 alpha amylase catalytic region [Desulforamulus ruminis DSM 2154]
MNPIEILHDTHNHFFRSPFGAVPCAEEVNLRVEVYASTPPDSVTLRLWKMHGEEKVAMELEEQTREKFIYRAQILTPDTPGLLWYYFIVRHHERDYYYGNNHRDLGGVGQVWSHEPPSFQITVHAPNASTPDWFKESVMYQIFVDRFYNGSGEVLNLKQHCIVYPNWEAVPAYGKDPETGKTVCYDIFGGNLPGVMAKLPYLKELGINVIYFNPVFEASSNHKYDTGDYKQIDPMFGDNRIFQELCQKAGEMGIRIILDGVFSHTGSDSVYFNKEGRYPGLGAYQSKESPYYSWYRFFNYPDSYDCWWNIDTLPNVNELDPAYQNFIIDGEDSVLKHWMKLGASGWRLDVVDELPEEFVKKFYRTMKSVNPQSVLIGEVWEDASRKVSYGALREYLLGSELDSVMNYPFRKIWLDFLLGHADARETHLALMNLYENYPLQYFYSTMNLLGTHDVTRVLTLLSGAPSEETLTKEEQRAYRFTREQTELGIARLKLLSLIQMTFPGVPCIYYGDEAGMHGYGDPLNRATYPWGKENKELLEWYRKLIALRHRFPVLKTGRWISLQTQGRVYGYVRLIQKGLDVFNRPQSNQVAVILFNADTERPVGLSLDVGRWCCSGRNLSNLLQEKEIFKVQDGMLSLSLQPLEGKLLMDGNDHDI